MWSFIKNLFFQKSPPEFFTGAISPTKDQLDEMPKFEELVATASPVVWKQLDLTKLQKYPIYSQNGSCSCVAMSVCLIASILYFMRTNISTTFKQTFRQTFYGNDRNGRFQDSFKRIAPRNLDAIPELK
jgi:hypothetical protein